VQRPNSRPITLALGLLAGSAFAPALGHQETALKDLMPKGTVIGVAINQRQFDGADAAAASLIAAQFNQISPENVLKFQPTVDSRPLHLRRRRRLRAVRARSRSIRC
jgi:hypothetical protein